MSRRCPHCCIFHVVTETCDPGALCQAWGVATAADKDRVDGDEEERIAVYEARRDTGAA